MNHTYDTLRQAILDAYDTNRDLPRMTVISACGTGKTRQALGVFERSGASLTVVFEPTLSLITQTMEEWKAHTTVPFSSMIVCSDETVTEDEETKVTLNPDVVANWLSVSTDAPRVLFCTYQSGHHLSEIYEKYPFIPLFDLAIYDEAHVVAVNNSDSQFGLTLDDAKIRINQRVFFTATPKIFYEGGANSMDNDDLFGKTIFTYTNRQAVLDGLIKDFEVIVATVTTAQASSIIDEKKIVGVLDANVTAHSAATQIALSKAVQKYGINTILGFYSNVKNANQASNDFTLLAPRLNVTHMDSCAIDGGLPSKEITSAIERLKEGNYILNSCRVIGVGTNIPSVDGLIFADPKTSLIEIIQNIGRGQRKISPDDNTPLRVIIPMVVNEKKIVDGFHKLLRLLYLIRDQDEVALISKKLQPSTASLKKAIEKGIIQFLHCDTTLDEEFINSLELKIIATSRTYWTYDTCFEEASKYSSLVEWRTNHASSHNIAHINGWLDEIALRLNLRIRIKKGTITKELCMRMAKDFDCAKEFKKRYPSLWGQYMLKKNWIPEHFPEAGVLEASKKRGPSLLSRLFANRIKILAQGGVSEKGEKYDRDYLLRALKDPTRREWIEKNYPQLINTPRSSVSQA